MKHIIYFVLFIICYGNSEAQNIEDLLRDFNNLNAVSNSETYTERIVTKNNYVNALHDRIRMKDVDLVWLNNITNLIQNNPNILNSYLESDTYDFTAFILLLEIYDIELMSLDEKTIINSIYGHVFNDSILDILNNNSQITTTSQSLFDTYWNEIRDESIARVKSIVGID
jgi:hypothetical protein